MTIAIEARVDEDKLSELLAVGTELPELDFKQGVSTDSGQVSKRSQVELAKDIAAMQMLGGYIVIGALDDGKPSGKVTQTQIDDKLFDEAKLRGQFRKWIPEPFELMVGTHEVDGNWYVVMYIGPNREGLCVIQADGQYPDRNGKDKTVLSQGDVFARHGTASERWHQRDVAAFLQRMTDARKESWRTTELLPTLAQLRQSESAVNLTQLSASAYTWQLDEASFVDMTIELIRRADTIPITLFLKDAPFTARRIAESPDATSDFTTYLHRLTCLASVALYLDATDIFEQAVKALVEVYGITKDGLYGDDARVASHIGQLHHADIRFAVVRHAMALGAFCFSRAYWKGIRTIVLARKQLDIQHNNCWLTEGLVTAARNELMQTDRDGTLQRATAVSFVAATLNQMAWLQQHVDGGDDDVLAAIVQFDALAMLVAEHEVQAPQGSIGFEVYYPNFAELSWPRFEPVWLRMIEDEVFRHELGFDSLASLKPVMQTAQKQAQEAVNRHIAGIHRLTIPAVRTFLNL